MEHSHFTRPPDPEKPADKPTGRFGPGSALAVTALAYVGSQVVAGLALALYIQLSGKNPTEFADAFQASTTGQFISLVLVQAAMLAIIYWFVRRRNITLREIGLGRGPKGSDFGYALLCFVGYFIALAIAFTAVEKFLPSINLEQEQQLGFESASGTVSLVMIFVSLVVLPPIVEEIMIRGFLYSGLRRKLTKITAALVASVLFGVAHLQFASGAPLLYVAAIDTFVLSMVLVALREKTGSLWSGMIVHAMKNGLAFLALFVLNVR